MPRQVWRLPYDRPPCPACGTPLRIGGGPPVPVHPGHGKLVRLICPSAECPSRQRSFRFTAKPPPRHIPSDRRTPRVSVAGREQVKCSECGNRSVLSRSESHPDVGRFVFRCNTPACSRRAIRHWWELREGQPPTRLASDLIRRQTSGRNQPRLPIPEKIRPCGKCHRWRIGNRYVSANGRTFYRLRCQACRERQLYTLDGNLAPMGRWRYKYSLGDRPRCAQCGRRKVVSHPLEIPSIGKVLRYICLPSHRTAQCPTTPEFRIEKSNQPLSAEKLKRLRANTSFKVSLPGLSHAQRAQTIRCLTCDWPMRYQGVRRANTAHWFVCRRGHPPVNRYFAVGTWEELPQSARMRKAFPWGQRPSCPKCKRPLLSSGEWTDESGQHLYRLVCRNAQCGARDFHFNQWGALIHEPRRVFRRTKPRVGPIPRGAKRWCPACGQRPVSNPDDPRSRYCKDCRSDYTPQQLWSKHQAKLHGPDIWRVRGRLHRGRDVHRLRETLGWTQRELAEQAELSLPLIKKIEQETVPLTKKSRHRLAGALAAG